MASMKCPACGGTCNFVYGQGYVCDHCPNVYDGVEISDSIIDKLNSANAKRTEEYDFDGALRICYEVLEEQPDSQEANWCALLAEYQIIYLQNDEGEYVPTFLNPDVEVPLNKCKYYSKLNISYRTMADNIEKMRVLVVREAKSIPDYDVFISYRQHIGRNSKMETEESAWADEFYKLLSKQTGDNKLRVFYDKASLDSSNAGWEPHIYAALRSAKFLVLMGSSIDNINSTWVKNEWKRFIAYRNMGREKTVAVLAKNIDPMKLPDIALRTGQMIKADDKGWQEKLVKRANDACKENKDVPYLLNEAETFIQCRNFKKAKLTYLKVCNIEPRNSKAYWGLLMCKLKAMDDYDLIKGRKKLIKINEYNDAVRYAVGKEKDHYSEICNAQLTHNTNGYDRTNYNIWLKKSKVKRFFKKVAIIASVLVVCAFGVYSYFGISNPISYEIEGNQATLSGKSIYFNLVVKNLEVDTYNDYPVVKIGDGALQNSKIKSVKLSDSVNEIGDGAFANCKSLTTFEMSNCTYIGANAFNSCVNLKELKIGITDTTVIAGDAFFNLNKNVTVSVPTVAEKAMAKLKAEYPDVTFATYTQDKVEECKYFIAKLSSVSNESDTDIQKAENLYNALNASEKAQITNYGILQNARLCYNAVSAINAIGTVTLNSGAVISQAENLYGALTAEQKKAVSNYTNLTTARAVYNTMAQIAEIGEVQINSEPKIVKAEEAYLALSYEQRDLVTNYSTLTAARTRVDTLLAAEVTAKITQIGSVVNLDSEPLIMAAESAYNGLTEGQKNKVTNHDALTDARAVYNTIKAIDNIGEITITSNGAIETAQKLFDGLTSAQQLKVINHGELDDASAVYNVMKLINVLGIISVESLPAIEQAEIAYANLNTERQAKIGNYEKLTNSRKAYTVVAAIEEIGKLNEESGPQLDSVQSLYDGLTANQKNLVGNYTLFDNLKKAFGVIELIEAIDNYIEVESYTGISKAEKSYNNLTSGQKNLVNNYPDLSEALDIYKAVDAINKIGSITINSNSAITAAENQFESLDEEQKLRVSNSSDLQDALAVYPVVEKINAIGMVNIYSLNNIITAESEYASLSAVRQAKVTNYGVLTDSRAAYGTVVLIEDIGKVSENSGTKIEVAQKSYKELTNSQQNLVSNADTLKDATKIYGVLSEINNIGDISLESLSIISSAESAYSSLNSSQKELITNYKVLTTARAIYNLETVVDNLGTLVLGSGENYNYKTLTTSNMVVELNNRAKREAIDSVTREGFKLFTASENNAFFEVFPNFKIVRYDLSKNQTVGETFTITSACTNIGLIGNHTFTYTDSQIKFESRYSNISLELWNFNITSPKGKSAIDATEVPSQYSVTLNFVGTNAIRGADGSNGAKGDAGKSSLTLSVISGKDGEAGISGANAISANALKINILSGAVVSMYGGVGGNGGNGGNGASCNVSNDGYAQCGHGGLGGNGGLGGHAIAADSTVISNNGNFEIYGGNGGSGGNGGNGGNNSDTGTDKPDHGGNGGNGGNGGIGGCAIKANTIKVTGNAIKVTGGDGAVGGNGGDGGNGHSNTWYPNGTRGGNAGNGGNGGDGGASLSVVSSNAIMSAGTASIGGSAGAIGKNAGNSKYNGTPGNKGNDGIDGER